jgi:hypothetical protein
MGLFGIDANKASTALTNAQVTSQYGAALGGATAKGGIGAASSGTIIQGGIKVAKGGSVSIVLPPPATQSATNGVNELQSNQALNTQSFVLPSLFASLAMSLSQELQPHATDLGPATVTPDNLPAGSGSAPIESQATGSASAPQDQSPTFLQSLEAKTGMSSGTLIAAGVAFAVVAGIIFYKLRK